MFEDRATLGVIHRAVFPVPSFDVANSTQWCNITVSTGLHISYFKQANRNLSASLFEQHQLRATIDQTSWRAGMIPSGNLGGTLSTLSGIDGSIPLNCTSNSPLGVSPLQPMYCTLGVASKDGWAVLNDTGRSLIDPSTDWIMQNPRVNHTATSEDLYIFMYGTEYRAAVKALTTISGRQPVPPRHTFGVHWSRYCGLVTVLWSRYCG